MDADAKGNVELCEVNGTRRVGMWDWIPPLRHDALELWHVNGFRAWRRLPSEVSPNTTEDR